jgi:hypothetical protein
MKNLIESIINKDYVAAREGIFEQLENIRERKLHEMKKMVAAKTTINEKVRVKNYDKKAAQDVANQTAKEMKPKQPSEFFASIIKKKLGKKDMSVNEEKVHNDKGEHIGDVMEITGSHAKDPTRTVKKYRAERKDGKTLITADKSAAREFLESH